MKTSIGGAILMTLMPAAFAASGEARDRPQYVPIGVATAGTATAAWILDTANNRVINCTPAEQGRSVRCAEGPLPPARPAFQQKK